MLCPHGILDGDPILGEKRAKWHLASDTPGLTEPPHLTLAPWGGTFTELGRGTDIPSMAALGQGVGTAGSPSAADTRFSTGDFSRPFVLFPQCRNRPANGLSHMLITSKSVCLGLQPVWVKTKINCKLAKAPHKQSFLLRTAHCSGLTAHNPVLSLFSKLLMEKQNGTVPGCCHGVLGAPRVLSGSHLSPGAGADRLERAAQSRAPCPPVSCWFWTSKSPHT